MGAICSSPKQKYITPINDSLDPQAVTTVSIKKNSETLSFIELIATLGFIPLGIVVFDSGHTIIYSNETIGEIMGFKSSQLIGRNLSEFVNDSILEELQEDTKLTSFNSQSSRFLHFKNVHGESHTYLFKIKNQKILSQDKLNGTEEVSIMFLQSISPYEAELLSIKDTLLVLSAIPIVGANHKGILSIFNKAAEETFGWKIEEAIGQNCNILIPERFAKYHDQFIANYIRTGKGKVVDKMRKENAVKKNGSSFPIELKITCIRIQGDSFFVGYARDRSTIITREEESQRAALADQIFPASIAARVTNGDKIISDFHDNASLLFCDIKGYTALSSQISPQRVVKLLDEIFSGFDSAILEKLNVEKIKTIGDCYMLGSGFPGEFKEHASELVDAAFKMIEVMQVINRDNTDLPVDIALRFGISSGPVICGIVGKKKPLYDCWSSTVNMASRMESTGIPGEIQISEETFSQLKPHHRKMFYQRNNVEVKGRGTLNTYITNFTGHLPNHPVQNFNELSRISSKTYIDELKYESNKDS